MTAPQTHVAGRRPRVAPEGSRVGVDTGGTFTDFVRLGPGGLATHKVRSTPDDPSRSFLEGIARLSADRAPVEVVHGSTVGTNALLERKGVRVALVATEGFTDVLKIGRQTRSELYNIFVTARRPLVEDGLVFGAPERLGARGETILELDEAAVGRLAATLAGSGAEMVAVCFLHSYANASHESRAARILRRAGLRVCCSHEVLPEHREYERWSTTVVNAYVTPVMDRYLARVEAGLPGSRLRVMQSNGGSISAAAARAQAARTVLSGPAAGVAGARAVARAAGFEKIISFDMGGTSTDVSLVDGEIGTTTDSVIGDFPVRLPMIDIHTVGAGGGSIAAVDSGGALRVGPRSAGAAPGPACYGSGNELTVTDANLLMGRLDPDYFLGGQMKLDAGRAGEAARDLSGKLKLSVEDLAEGVTRVANASMERALRVVSVQRGRDPRDFALLAFGGAGGMHACEIAERLEIGTVIVPRHAGVLSALGTLLADVTKDYSASVLRPGEELGLVELEKKFKPLLREAVSELSSQGFAPGRQVIERLVDIRYAGQSYEITVPFTRHYRREFDRRHDRLYGYSNPERPTETVNLRVKASGLTDKPPLPSAPNRASRPLPSFLGRARFNGRTRRAAYYRWEELSPGARGPGPAVVIGREATAVVPPGFGFRVDGFGNLILRKGR